MGVRGMVGWGALAAGAAGELNFACDGDEGPEPGPGEAEEEQAQGEIRTE